MTFEELEKLKDTLDVAKTNHALTPLGRIVLIIEVLEKLLAEVAFTEETEVN